MEFAAEELQSVIEQAGQAANSWMMAKYDQLNPLSMKKLLAGGTKLHSFSPRDHAGQPEGDKGIVR